MVQKNIMAWLSTWTFEIFHVWAMDPWKIPLFLVLTQQLTPMMMRIGMCKRHMEYVPPLVNSFLAAI